MQNDRKSSESDLIETSAVAKPEFVILNLSSIRKVLSQEVRDPGSLGESKFGPVWCLSTQLETVCEGHERWPDILVNRQQSDAQISYIPGKMCEETNLQLSPQLETVCEGGRSINSKCGS